MRRLFLVILFTASSVSTAASTQPLDIAHEGQITIEGHYARPHDTKTYRSLRRVVWDGGARLRLQWTTWADGDSARDVESTLLLGDRVLEQGAGQNTWIEKTGKAADESRLLALADLPNAFGAFPGGRRWNLLGAPESPTGAVSPVAHPRLGDVRDSVAYGPSGDGAAPATVSMRLEQRDHGVTLNESFVSASVPGAAALDSFLTAPADSQVSGDDPARAPGAARIENLAPGIWAVERDDLDSRSVVVEMADGLVLLESAVGSEEGEALLRAIHGRWPGVPVRWFLFSHHHPHYLGGIRPIMADGVAMIVTPGNAAYVREIAARRFTTEPDRLERDPVPLQLTVVENGRFTLADRANEVVAVDIGALSSHTDEFLVYYFPREKLLFQAELGWFVRDGELRASRRSRGLLQAIEEQGLDVERLVQSWPMVENRRELTLAELKELVTAPKHP